MNDKPNMAEDFVLNGNCETTQDQTLKDKLCSGLSQPEATRQHHDIPRVGVDISIVLPIIGAILMVVVMFWRNRHY